MKVIFSAKHLQNAVLNDSLQMTKHKNLDQQGIATQSAAQSAS